MRSIKHQGLIENITAAQSRSVGASPRLGLGYESALLGTMDMLAAAGRSMPVPFGTTLPDPAWFFSHEPLRWPLRNLFGLAKTKMFRSTRDSSHLSGKSEPRV